jgi:hypothetical protein
MLKQQQKGRFSCAMSRVRDFFCRKKYSPSQPYWHKISSEGYLVRIKKKGKYLEISLVGQNAVSLVTTTAKEAIEVKKHMQEKLGSAESVLDNQDGLKTLYFIYQPIPREKFKAYSPISDEIAERFTNSFICDKTGKNWGVVEVKDLEPTNLTELIKQINSFKASKQ